MYTDLENQQQQSKPKRFLSCDIVFAVIILLAVALGLGALITSLVINFATGRGEAQQIFNTGAVASDSPECSSVGSMILQKGGSAVDAAIASGLCLGVLRPYASGIGGGCFMMVQLSNSSAVDGKRSFFIDARERAGVRATSDMYIGQEEQSELGAMASGIPGEIAGYWAAHQRFGKLPWKDLFEPAIQYAKNGFKLDLLYASRIKGEEANIMKFETIKTFFTKQKDGKQVVLEQGDFLKPEALGKTLEIIAQEGAQAMYNCSHPSNICKNLVAEIQAAGGILTEEDFENYFVRVKDPLRTSIQLVDGDKKSANLDILTAPIPSSGAIVNFMMHLFNQKKKDQKKTDDPSLDSHYMIEALKHGFAHRMSLGDLVPDSVVAPLYDEQYISTIAQKIDDTKTFEWAYYMLKEYAPSDLHGTSHLTIVDKDRNVVGLTTTVNFAFGSKFMSPTTGIMLNNQMSDFTVNPNKTNPFGLPPSPANFIKPGKAPMSSMAPTIFLDHDTQEPVFSVGASGGPTIISSVFEVALRTLMLESNNLVKGNIDKPRFHVIVGKDSIQTEEGAFTPDVQQKLTAKGHKIDLMKILPDGHFVGNTQAIMVKKDRNGKEYLLPGSDMRKAGRASGY